MEHRSFPRYLDVLAGRQADVDFAAQVPHSPYGSMSWANAARRAWPLAGELEQMRVIVRDAVAATGRYHLSATTAAHGGGLTRALGRCRQAELLALAQGLADAGTGGVPDDPQCPLRR